MEKIHFEDRVVIITGAGNGLGKDYALKFAALGANVLVNDFGRYKTKQGDVRYFADDVVE
jgi:NAD(P)-dependent dehydrogenase (short-subunit alcohol dehydrogenase family)